MNHKDSVVVEATFDQDGTPRPRAFTWRGKRRVITSWGRSREHEGVLHMLVMVRVGEVFELAYRRTDAAWLLLRSPDDFGSRHDPM